MQCREALKREEQGKQNIKSHNTKKKLQKNKNCKTRQESDIELHILAQIYFNFKLSLEMVCSYLNLQATYKKTQAIHSFEYSAFW